MQRSWIVAAMILAAFASGCAKNKGNKSNGQNELAAKLASVPLSGELTISSLDTCEQDVATQALDATVTPDAGHAQDIWNKCQALYACSPVTAEFLQSEFQTGSAFKMGFADLKKLNVSTLGDKVGGVYLPQTENVYLDTTLTKPRDICHMLLHEIVHRLDPVAYGGEESLRTEYKAYWHQVAFVDELVKDAGPLGEQFRAHMSASIPVGGVGGSPSVIPYHTRESLIRDVATLYGFQLDMTLIQRYPKLPREPEVPAGPSGVSGASAAPAVVSGSEMSVVPPYYSGTNYYYYPGAPIPTVVVPPVNVPANP